MHEIRRRIHDHLLRQIAQGVYPPNQRIPTEMALAGHFRTNRMNVHLAIKALGTAGIVACKKRGGTVVRRAVSHDEAMSLMAGASRRVRAVCCRGAQTVRHWNERTLQTLADALSQEGFGLTCTELACPPTRASLRCVLGDATKDGAAALVLFPDHTRTERFFRRCLDLLHGFPGAIYLLNRGGVSLEDWPFHAVSLDPFAEGLMVGRRLRYLGAANVFFLSREDHGRAHWVRQRARGLAMGFAPSALAPGAAGRRRIRHVTTYHELSVLLRSVAAPAVVVAANDACAAGFVDFAGKRGLVAPRDFGLIGFDDDPAFRAYALTTVAPPVEHIGRTFGRLIAERPWRAGAGEAVAVRLASAIIPRSTYALEGVDHALPSSSLAS